MGVLSGLAGSGAAAHSVQISLEFLQRGGGAELGAGNAVGAVDAAAALDAVGVGGAPKFGAWPIDGEEDGERREQAGHDFHGPRPFRGRPNWRLPREYGAGVQKKRGQR